MSRLLKKLEPTTKVTTSCRQLLPCTPGKTSSRWHGPRRLSSSKSNKESCLKHSPKSKTSSKTTKTRTRTKAKATLTSETTQASTPTTRSEVISWSTKRNSTKAQRLLMSS